MSQSDDQGRSESAAPEPGNGEGLGSEPTQPYGRPPYGHPPYGQPPYGSSTHPYGQPPNGQAGNADQQNGHQQNGQPPNGQQQSGQQPYGQQYQPPAAYGDQYGQQPAYGQQYGQAPAYGPYGSGQPAKPGTVVTAAVLGFVFGALGVIFTLLMIAAGSAASSIFGTLSSDVDGTTGVVAGVIVLAGVAPGWAPRTPLGGR